MTAPPNFGPWASQLRPGERVARLRGLRALSIVFCGLHHPLTRALAAAETDKPAAQLALVELDKLPPLPKRRLLTTFAALSAPPRP